MKNTDKKSTAALIWIGVYVVAMSIGETLNSQIGVVGGVTAALGLALSVALYLYIRRAGGFSEICLRPLHNVNWRTALYCLPLIVLATVNLWRGAVMSRSPLETALYILAMLCVGWLEEALFRGLLFRALLAEQKPSLAILISSVTFGLGHIVNLLNGAELLPTLLQLVYAVAIGLMLTVFVYRVGNLFPCIVFHRVFNALSAFANEAGLTNGVRIATAAAITVLSVGYAAYLWFRYPAQAQTTAAAL